MCLESVGRFLFLSASFWACMAVERSFIALVNSTTAMRSVRSPNCNLMSPMLATL